MRFFRKLKPLDFLIIIALIVAGVILFRFFNPEKQWVDATVYSTNTPLFQVNSFRVGDVERDPSGNIIAEITRVRAYDTPHSLVANKDVLVSVRILAKVNPRSGDFEYKNKVIKVGSAIDLRFDTGFFAGKVASLGEQRKPVVVEDKTITVVIYDQWPWFADSIKVGDSEKSERGEEGKSILEVISKEVRQAEVTVTTPGGNSFKTTDPRKVDITLKLKVRVRRFGGEITFRHDERVAVGELTSFTVGNTRIKDALIKDIE